MTLVQDVPLDSRPTSVFHRIVGTEAMSSLERTASRLRDRVRNRIIWNINSTAAGGGVAEMLHALLPYARGLGIDTRWLVIGGNAEFFRVTKRLHHALHGGKGDGSDLGNPEREIYEQVMRENLPGVLERVSAGDVVILHDPQTAGLAPELARRGAVVLWRCHIGDDRDTPEAALGWRFLAEYLPHARHYIFSRDAYVPMVCDRARTAIVAPSIDPFSPKNRDLSLEDVRAILVETGLIGGGRGVGSVAFDRADGTRGAVTRGAEVIRSGGPPDPETPLVVQVSRWDPLKDPVGVMDGFTRMGNGSFPADAHLVLAGPNVRGVTDDPEGGMVFEQVADRWKSLPGTLRGRVHLASLPMDDLEENAVMVNALQRHARVVVQKSLREGFGLTVTEAMWKSRPVVASAVGGIQDQVRHRHSGLLLDDPTDLDGFAETLAEVLEDRDLAADLGRGARDRVAELYLGTRSLSQYAELIRAL